jgi:DNA-binding MarR family transcriptional regulator
MQTPAPENADAFTMPPSAAAGGHGFAGGVDSSAAGGFVGGPSEGFPGQIPEDAVHEATVLLREFRTVTAEFEATLGKALTVNPTDLVAMEHLIQDGPLTPTELSSRLGLTTAAMTTSIDRLTAVGHVTRVPNPADRRGVLVVPAPESIMKAMSALMPMIMGVDRVLASFDETEKAIITDYLRRVVDVYREHARPAER